jgi:hypothetical protein
MSTKYQRAVAAEAARRASLTPYDKGTRAEPKVWEARHREDDGDYGKVDFNNEEGGTIATLYIEMSDDRSYYTLKGYTNEPLRVEIDDQS